jgi:hypothetical protein
MNLFYLPKVKMTEQILLTQDPIQTFLRTRISIQYLEDPYFIYIKPPVDQNWRDLEKLLEIPYVFYWFAFTFAGHHKLYNIIWGTFSDGVVSIVNGCTYRINKQAKLSILNASKNAREDHGFFYLGGAVRDRVTETMQQYLSPTEMLDFPLKSNRTEVKNRTDIAQDVDRIGLPPELLQFMLEKITDAIEHSKISVEPIPQTCPSLNQCFNSIDEMCQLYHHGSECFLDPSDRHYKQCTLDVDLR